MSTATSAPSPLPLLTAEQFAELPDDGRRIELVRGRIVELTPPKFPHGDICSELNYQLRKFAKEQKCGWVVSHDTGVLTTRSPDSVRGPDIAYYSYRRLPAGIRPQGYPDVAPDLVIEVRSPSNRWADLLVKVGEYLQAGVTAVCIVDPDRRQANVFRDDTTTGALHEDDTLEFPDVLPGFSVPLRELFR